MSKFQAYTDFEDTTEVQTKKIIPDTIVIEKSYERKDNEDGSYTIKEIEKKINITKKNRETMASMNYEKIEEIIEQAKENLKKEQ